MSTHMIMEWEPDGTPEADRQQIVAIWDEEVTREMLDQHLVRSTPGDDEPEHKDLLDKLLAREHVYLETEDGLICLFLQDSDYTGVLH